MVSTWRSNRSVENLGSPIYLDDPYYARNDDIQNNKVVVVVDDIRILEIRTNTGSQNNARIIIPPNRNME